jgi:hypothetical protein
MPLDRNNLFQITSAAWDRFTLDVIGSGSPLAFFAQSIEPAGRLLLNHLPIVVTSSRRASANNALLTDSQAMA